MNNTKAKSKARKSGQASDLRKPKNDDKDPNVTDVGLRSLLRKKKSRLSLIAVAVLTVVALGGLAYAKNQADDKAVEPTVLQEIPTVDTVTE